MIMEPADWYIEGCVKASEEEWALYREWTGHLPVREESTPYHSGPHSIKNFRHALAIAGLSEEFRVLEVGFCLGHSAEIFYRLGAASVVSVENSDRAQTLEAAAKVKSLHENFIITKPEHQNWPRHYIFQFGFIDGDHGFQAIRNDLSLMRARRVPWVLFDDFWPHWGDTQIVFKEQGITPVAILGTMALCKFPA
jgi:hypothetical protein